MEGEVISMSETTRPLVLAEQVEIVMPPVEWEAFCKALDAPPRSIPALKKLLTEASFFDGKGKADAQ